MTPLDEAPEHRWRRTVDRRNRPAKLKVDRLLRDFGYAELDAHVGDAIEARLAGVALAVAPSLRNAAAGEVVTIYANDSPALEEGRAAADAAAITPPPPAEEEPAVASDVAQMVTYLKQQVLDARGEAGRLRTELDRRIAARVDSERESERIIAEQAAALEQQSRQLAELSAALNSTREALAETRDEIRRAVGELQALPEPATADDAAPLRSDAGLLSPEPDRSGDADDETGEAGSLSGEEWGDGREEAEAAGPPPDELGDPTASPEDRAVDLGEPDLAVEDAPAPAAQDPAFDLDDEPGLEVGEGRPRVVREPDFELEVPVRDRDRRAPAVEDPTFDLDEPPLRADGALQMQPELELDEPAQDVGRPAAEQHEIDLGERAPEPAARERADDLDAPLPPSSEWLPVDLRSPADEGAPTAASGLETPVDDATSGGEGAADFDDFLYAADELYDPDEADPAAFGTPLESEIEARWPDEPTTALPPPPPAPPSPWAEEPDPQPPGAIAERATLGKVLRGRGARGGGRGRGRWEGSCSICGRQPQENRRKDLHAAGWDLDDEAPACPQCRGVG